MGQALNTTVNGSSGMCVDAADWLSSLYGGASVAADAVRGARDTAATEWHGPAHDAFRESLNGLPVDTDELADRAYQCEWALREFAASLDKAVDTMSQALAKAHAGGLRIDSPFIIAPQAPALPSGVPTKCTPGMANAELARMRHALVGYDTATDVYNANAAVYNE
ncbi:MAG: hypothetical protein ACRDQ5_03975, partial [Sciscionella sp.]